MKTPHRLCVFLLVIRLLHSTPVSRVLRTDCRHGGVSTKPFYIGTTHLQCMLKTGINMALSPPLNGRKRRALQVPEIDMSHSYLSYENVLLEFGLNGTRIEYQGYPMFSESCPSAYLPVPAGFSYLSVDCIVKCAKNYHIQFGNYKIFSNNCNTFTNIMLDILCHEIRCPYWCR
uniref:PPPDE domain-containing protein n=1 Tax=Magallana gigas TaxID=29159 RepID=A0A8W8IJN2_MAGGI